MDSTFLLYVYIMIVMGCVTVWAGLYQYFVQAGLIITRVSAERANSAAPEPANGQRERSQQIQLVTDADVHQAEGEQKSPDSAAQEIRTTPIRENSPSVGGIASLTKATLTVNGSNGSSTAMNGQETKTPTKVARSASEIKSALLRWCQSKTKGYPHVNITNYSKSWCDGMAFCALIHHFYPDAFDFSQLDPKNRRENFDLAFQTAEKLGDIAQLLEVDDMIAMGDHPEYKCVFTYVQQFYRRFHNVP